MPPKQLSPGCDPRMDSVLALADGRVLKCDQCIENPLDTHTLGRGHARGLVNCHSVGGGVGPRQLCEMHSGTVCL